METVELKAQVSLLNDSDPQAPIEGDIGFAPFKQDPLA